MITYKYITSYQYQKILIKKLDSDNLITLCRMHHEQVEKGIISKEELYELLEVPPEGR